MVPVRREIAGDITTDHVRNFWIAARAANCPTPMRQLPLFHSAAATGGAPYRSSAGFASTGVLTFYHSRKSGQADPAGGEDMMRESCV
jgi:hypothetical protein